MTIRTGRYIRKEIKIATVYSRLPFDKISFSTIDTICWFKISQALAKKGHRVDIVIKGKKIEQIEPNLRYVPYSKANWRDYDIVKTFFHEGFESLLSEGGGCHPFIISRLGSVVSNKEQEGVYFYGTARQKLYSIQKEIRCRSKYVVLFSQLSRNLWENEFGGGNNTLLVPTGVDKLIPHPKKNPYKNYKKIAVFIGNIYSKKHQRDVNLRWQLRLNNLGKALKKKGIVLCMIGGGEIDRLKRNFVIYMGSIENKDIWDYQYFANVGIVFAQGEKQHNESSKIYYYLRSGLPVVSESPIPNNNVIKEAGLGLIADYDDDKMMADLIEEAVYRNWNRKRAIKYILENHTWDKRIEIYERIMLPKL